MRSSFALVLVGCCPQVRGELQVAGSERRRLEERLHDKFGELGSLEIKVGSALATGDVTNICSGGVTDTSARDHRRRYPNKRTSIMHQPTGGSSI
jgi:hypothetical protein